MSYSVEVVTEEGDDWRQLLRIRRNGETVEEHTDSGEPEDNRFYRDWSWVAPALEAAYQFGLQDGRVGY